MGALFIYPKRGEVVSNDTNSLSGIHEQIQKLKKEVFEEDGKFERLKEKVSLLEESVKWQGKEIGDIKENLKTILDNTTWLKRAILTAIIGALTTAIIGGAIALIWTTIGK